MADVRKVLFSLLRWESLDTYLEGIKVNNIDEKIIKIAVKVFATVVVGLFFSYAILPIIVNAAPLAILALGAATAVLASQDQEQVKRGNDLISRLWKAIFYKTHQAGEAA